MRAILLASVFGMIVGFCLGSVIITYMVSGWIITPALAFVVPSVRADWRAREELREFLECFYRPVEIEHSFQAMTQYLKAA